MKNSIYLSLIFLLLVLSGCLTGSSKTVFVPSPIFIDPNYHGSCDPEVIYNPADSAWYIYYTARKGNRENTFLGTPLGVIRSKNLVDWQFLGYCKFDGVGGAKDAGETFWAPAITVANNTMHMFVTWKPDTLPLLGAWGGPGKIVHYQTSVNDPVNGWSKVADMHDTTMNSLDATVYFDSGNYHVWYKGKAKGQSKNELYHLVSSDLYNWEEAGFSQSDVFNAAASGSNFEEAPYVFDWKGAKWLITDPHNGLFVYKGYDGDKWKFQGTILKEGGIRLYDTSMARHCSVAVVDGRAFIFYHVEPWRDYKGKPIFKQPVKNRRSVIQMAELELVDGILTCDRNKEISFELKQ
jgi:hypothetical protein